MKIIRSLFLFMFSGLVGFVSIPMSFFWLNIPFVQSVLIGIGIPALTVFWMGGRFLWKRMRNTDPYREEIAYVKHQVKEANKKVSAIGACRYKVRSLAAWMKIAKLHKLAKGIIKMVEEDPARYREVQVFFTQYLPATVTLVDRYTFLLKQPVRSIELKESLREAELLLDEMAENSQQVLLGSLSSDMMSLEVERKMLKNSFEYQPSDSIDVPKNTNQ